MIISELNIELVKEFIIKQSPETKIYIGGDSERHRKDGVWYANYTVVVAVHINGKNGCRVFGEVTREADYDQRKDRPAMRLMNEVIKTAELYLKLAVVLEDRHVEIHIDINPNNKYGSSCVITQATGYIKGVCNMEPMVKPDSWAASFCADRFEDAIYNKKAA